MNEIQRAKLVLKILNKTYPKIKVPLKSRNVFTLLITSKVPCKLARRQLIPGVPVLDCSCQLPKETCSLAT